MTALERARKKLVFRRKEAGLSRGDLAKRIGVSMYTVASWERGEREPPVSSLEDWCDSLGVSISWAVGEGLL